LTNDITASNFANANTAVGAGALQNNVDGDSNTAVGAFALNTQNGAGGFPIAVSNNAVGRQALFFNTTGSFNQAMGVNALINNDTGSGNVAIGDDAMFFNVSGSGNTAVGGGAGSNYTAAESGNICIGSGVAGVAGEDNNIRIGDNLPSNGIIVGSAPGVEAVLLGTGLGTQGISVLSIIGFGTVQIGNGLSTVALASSCNIGGIYNQSFGPADMAVRIGSDNKLGTVVSSRRFKHDIKPMDKASDAVLALKPVTFQYNSDKTDTPRFGLIAEDVAEVSPELVIPDKEGKPLSVRYEDVNVMLLNEFLKEHKKVEGQQATITELKATVAQQAKGMEVLTAQLKEQAAQIQKVSAQLEVNKPAPQVVVNKP
jgi:hypothetical protein